MKLSKENIGNINKSAGVSIPDENYFALPEKVLQFGTGVLLRGLPDYFIDKANKQGIFNGRVLVVKSTSNGGTDAFSTQDNLYTHCVRGILNGERIDETIVNASISRVLSAKDDWAEVMKAAGSKDLQIITSNTTEIGIVLEDDDITKNPPTSFPGKVLAFLYERSKLFNGSADSGMVIVPAELITDNGKKLKGIVLEQAKRHSLGNEFINWLGTANDFCNTLVDRIVPGKLPEADKAAVEAAVGYTDELIIMSEVYSLWAIETVSARTKEILSFSKADTGVILTDDITKYKELKLRLLNGSHTFTCGLALAKGFKTVKEAMANEEFNSFITHLMMNETVPAILTEDITKAEAETFAYSVLDRYRNPFIEHNWIAITAQYSLKMKCRNVETIKWFYKKLGTVPAAMATGFAAYILFMHSSLNGDTYTGNLNGKEYNITDQNAGLLYNKWQQNSGIQLVENILQEEELWGESLANLPGFSEAVFTALQELQHKKVLQEEGI